MLYAQIEADCCNAVKADCEDLREKAALVIKGRMDREVKGGRDRGMNARKGYKVKGGREG